MADRVDAGNRSPQVPAPISFDRCRGAPPGRPDAAAEHSPRRGHRRGRHPGGRSPTTTQRRWQARCRPRRTGRSPKSDPAAADHPPVGNAELRSTVQSRLGHVVASAPRHGSRANPARPTATTTTATTMWSGMTMGSGMTGRGATQGRRLPGGRRRAIRHPTNGPGRHLSTRRRAARSPDVARRVAEIRRARSRRPVARRRHQAGAERRNPRSRYEVPTGGDNRRDGAPGARSMIEPGVSTSAARASRQCAIIARAVDSGSSICGTCPQPASTSSLEPG